jgi:Fe-S cluster assembly protein SufD
MEVDVAPAPRFHHVRTQGRDHKRRAITHVFARLGEKSVYKSFTLTMNGVLTRNEQVVELTGDEAVAHVAGACLGDGDFHHDDTVFVTHDAVACESRQVFKKVLRNGATGVFQGKILVKPGAQQTDGYQISQALLLDEDAQFLAKPELEIYADDVKCSHGSTRARSTRRRSSTSARAGCRRARRPTSSCSPSSPRRWPRSRIRQLAEEIQSRLEGWLARRRK